MPFILPILYFSYTLCFWGATLIGGGPQGTGSWPFLYTLTGLGPGPQTPSQQPGGTQTTTPPGNSVIPGQSTAPAPGIFGLPPVPGVTTGVGAQYCTGQLQIYTPPGGWSGVRLPQDWVWQVCGGAVGQVSRDCVRMLGYDCAPGTIRTG